MVLPRPDFEERYLDVGKGILAREKDIMPKKMTLQDTAKNGTSRNEWMYQKERIRHTLLFWGRVELSARTRVLSDNIGHMLDTAFTIYHNKSLSFITFIKVLIFICYWSYTLQAHKISIRTTAFFVDSWGDRSYLWPCLAKVPSKHSQYCNIL